MPSGIYQHKIGQGFQIGHGKLYEINGMLGKYHSQKTKKEYSEIRKGNIYAKGHKGYNWKGDWVGYVGLHIWVMKKKGHPTHCEHCGKTGEKIKDRWNIHWSNIDHKYRRILDDFIGLCVPCHKDYDIKNGLYIQSNKYTYARNSL